MPFTTLNQLQAREFAPGFFGKFVHAQSMTTAHWQIKGGSVAPVHQHIHEQVAILISGRLELTIAGETRVMEAGDVATIPSNVLHGAKALTDCYLIDVFQPVREDYR